MRRIYSAKAPFASFHEQTHITPVEEFQANWKTAASSIQSKEDLIRYVQGKGSPHRALLERFYQDSSSVLALSAGDAVCEFPLLSKYSDREIILSDLCPFFLEIIGRYYPIDVRQIDSKSIDFPSNRFDFVYSMASEYVFDDAECYSMVSEMARVLKPGKHMLISSVAVDFDRQAGAWRRWGRRLSRPVPPALWVLANRALLHRKVKLTGYARSLDELMGIFGSVPDIRIEEVHFHPGLRDAAPSRSVAFIIRKGEVEWKS